MRAVRAGDVRPLARSDVTETDLEDEMILFDPVDGTTHGLNQTAVVLWELCDGTRTLDDIAAELASTYNLEAAQAQADAAAFVEQFYTLGLLQSATDG